MPRHSLLQLLCLLSLATLGAQSAEARCDAFVEAVADGVDDYQHAHRVYPVDDALQSLARRWMPRLWVSPESWKPVDFDSYMGQARLMSASDGRVLAEPPIAGKLSAMLRDEQCQSYLEAPDLVPVSSAPVYIQAFRDQGPDGSDDWLYLKYSFVFDWSGLARELSFLAGVGASLAGGGADRWHRLDVHTATILGLDADRELRTVTHQQHNDKRTYVAGLDFDASNGVHIAAARGTNELYLDEGSSQLQRRRAVPSFLQWKHLIDAESGTLLWQVDEFVGRNAGAEEVPLRPVFPAPDYPLAAFAGALAPSRRLLGFYVGRDGPPGFDFTGIPELPKAVALGYWREGDKAFLSVLDRHLDGFRSTDWEAIRAYLAGRLGQALAMTRALRNIEAGEGAPPN